MQAGNDVSFQQPGSEFARTYNLVFIFGVSLFAAALLVVAACSLSWEANWDAMWVFRVTYLIFERGYAPHRDLFDGNMFGIIWIHGLVGAIGGYNDLSLRFFDLAWLTALCVCIWAIVRQFEPRAAIVAGISYGWLYLTQDEMQILQREHLMMLPIALGIYTSLATNRFTRRPWLQPVLIGFFFGVGVSIKPFCIFSLPIIALYDSAAAEEHGFSLHTFRLLSFRKAFWTLFFAAIGAAFPLICGFLWIYLRGGLPDFLSMVTEYWPLHRNLSIKDGIFSPTPLCDSKLDSLLLLFSFHNFSYGKPLVFGAIASLLAIAWNPNISRGKKGLCLLLGIGCVFSLVGMLLVGAYHPYSWMPVLFFLAQLHALCFSFPNISSGLWIRAAMPIIGIVVLASSFHYMSSSLANQLKGRAPTTIWTTQVNGIVDYLKDRLLPNDKVQPLDILGGTDRALTLLHADNGTFLTTDYFLYIHVNSPFVQKLRQRFLDEMSTNRPRYVVIVLSQRLGVFDPNDDGTYRKNFGDWLKDNYRIVHQTKDFQILEIQPANAAANKPPG